MSRIVQANDVDLFVADEGEGEVIVFVHGFPLDHGMWSPQLDDLTDSYRVIAPDLRGFGQSEDTAGTVTMEQFADDLAAMLDHLSINQPVTLCGLSMGGYIAFQFWKRHPDRLARLILCDTRSLPDSEEARQTRIDSAVRVLKFGAESLANTMPGKMFSTFSFENKPELIGIAQQTILSNSPVGISAAMLGMADRPDVTAWLPEIQVPTLVIVGEEDSISPPDEMQAIAAAIPNSQFVKIENAGHMAPLEQPDHVNSVIRQFLKS